MTILVDSRWNGAFGIGRYSREVTSRLQLDHRRVRGAPHHRFTPPPFSTAALAARTDVVYCPGFNAEPVSRARQILTIHDLIHLESEPRRWRHVYYDRVVRPAVLRSGLVFTVSETSRRAVSGWLDTDTVQVIVARNGCSSAFITIPSPPSTDRPFFLFVGNSKPHKRLDLLLGSLRDAELTEDLVAVVPDVQQATQLVRHHGLEARVRILSGLSDADLADLYRRATALVIPSSVEGFGLPALEALSCGTPVVYDSNCLAVREICEDGQFAFDTPNVDGLASAMASSATAVFTPPVNLAQYSWDTTAALVDDTLLSL